jgi:hypothetical protein
LWNGKDSKVVYGTYNEENIIKNMEVMTQPELITNTATNPTSNSDQLAELIKQIESLRAANAELQAAVASSNTAQTLESHPNRPQSEKTDAIGTGDGGDH